MKHAFKGCRCSILTSLKNFEKRRHNLEYPILEKLDYCLLTQCKQKIKVFGLFLTMKPITKGYKTHLNLPVPIPDEEKKTELNVYFHSSLRYLKRFYKELKSLHKTFSGTTKKCKNKHLP